MRVHRIAGAIVVTAGLAVAPATAHAGLVKSLVKAVPALTQATALTPTCTTTGGGSSSATRCTGPIPLYRCDRAGSPYAGGTGCEIAVDELGVAIGCGQGHDFYGGPYRTSCGADVGGTSLRCQEVDQTYPVGPHRTASTRTCWATGGTTFFSCTSYDGRPAEVSATCPEPVAVLDRLIEGPGS